MIPVRQEWPPEVAAFYRRAGYWTGETFGELLRARATAMPDHVAVVAGETRWTYRELDERADATAAGLLAHGLRSGDRAVVHLPNVAEFLSVVLGMFRAGILPVFALPAHRVTEIAHFAESAEAAAYVIPDVWDGFDYRALAAEVVARVPAVRHVIVAGEPGERGFTALRDVEAAGDGVPVTFTPSPSDVAFLQLSGGSTGLSKLIPRTHDDYLYSVRRSAELCALSASTVYLAVLPVAHNYPMSSPGWLGVLHAGGTIVLSPSPSPAVAFPIIERERVTITAVVPPLALVWLDAAPNAGRDLSSLRVLQVGGAKLPVEVARRIRPTLGVTLQQVFGMAEGLVNYTRLDDPEERIVTTQGRPMCPDDELRVVDDRDEPVAAGTPGHLLTRGPYTIRAYHNAPEANARAFTDDGFYRTGDIVRLRDDGYLVVEGRATDQINRGGEKVSADEVEDHLLAHPQVHDAAVVAVPDAFLGEKTCAFIVARGETPKAAAIRAWIRGRGLAAFKVPDQVVFVDAFPTTGVGKISRRQLRAQMRATLRARLASEPAGERPVGARPAAERPAAGG